MNNQWCLYILECATKELYVGITKDMDKRLASHNAGKASRFTRGRTPVKLLYTEPCSSHSEALKREYAVKQFSREEKFKLIKQQ